MTEEGKFMEDPSETSSEEEGGEGATIPFHKISPLPDYPTPFPYETYINAEEGKDVEMRVVQRGFLFSEQDDNGNDMEEDDPDRCVGDDGFDFEEPYPAGFSLPPPCWMESDGEDEENIGRKMMGVEPDDEEGEEEDARRRFAGECMLPNKPPLEGVVLRHIERENEEPGEYEYPERELREFMYKREDGGQLLDHYIPGDGVNDLLRPIRDPVIMPQLQYQRKPQPGFVDPRKERRSMAVEVHGEVWELLDAQEEEMDAYTKKMDWMIDCALSTYAIALKSGDIEQEESTEEDVSEDEDEEVLPGELAQRQTVSSEASKAGDPGKEKSSAEDESLKDRNNSKVQEEFTQSGKDDQNKVKFQPKDPPTFPAKRVSVTVTTVVTTTREVVAPSPKPTLSCRCVIL